MKEKKLDMVNFMAALRPMVCWLMKIVGVQPYTMEIEPGTVMNFWVPLETLKKKPNKMGDKPAVVLVQGFFFDGIMTWLFQAFALTKKYSVYIPDLLFFGGKPKNQSEREEKQDRERVEKSDIEERERINQIKKTYPIIYSAILHVEWHCSKIIKKFTIMSICNSGFEKFLIEIC